MSNYTVRFTRDSHGWTCSVYALNVNGVKAGTAVLVGTAKTQEAAKEQALSLALDIDVRAALRSADPTRPHWVQGVAGEKLETERRAEASRMVAPTRTRRSVNVP
jgi:hypothetical protein